ncbi:MAG TPA: amino acid adenylation domain-containing protein, partial [Longimicrobium sp.]|nr:amino acid adenylation domain-containing protein [Longimicrobium sp.]
MIGGICVARGYHGRLGLTAERFVPDPFASDAGARMYRTGDRVRRRADGALEFLGRIDFQVKVRGFRIELGEIEAAFADHPAVRQAVAVVREDAPGDARIVAYVVPDGAAPSTDELRQMLAKRLPDYMVPSAFVSLEAMPLTPNSKVDRKAMPAPDWSAEADYEAPRTATEQTLAALWCELLGVEQVGRTDGFFALGGHSLRAARVAARVRGVLGIELPLRAVFEHATLAELAAEIDRLRAAGTAALPALERVDRERALPLSFAQQRMWIVDRLEPGTAQYNMPVALRFSGELDGPALARSIGELIRRHEALRTTFVAEDGLPRQVIHPPLPEFELPFTDFSTHADAEADALRALREEAARPFDLEAGPLFRARMLRVAADEHLLVLNMHHAVSDAWSLGVLFREMWALYAAFAQGRPSPLAEPVLQYADFATWQRAALTGDVLEQRLAYWRAALAGAPAVLTLPTDRPRPPVQSFRGARATALLPPEVLEALRGVARREGATLFMTLLAGWQALLGAYAGQDDVVVGTPVAGRTHAETEGMVGAFINTLALRGDLSGDPSFRALLGRVRETTLGALAHQDLPFEKLVEEVQTERSLGHAPIFQVMFALHEAERAPGELPGVTVRGESVCVESTKFDLTLTLAPGAEGLDALLDYSTDLFDAATAERMLEHLGRLLAQVAQAPDAPLSRVRLMTEEERRVVVEEWNWTDRPYPRDVTINDLFEAQVRRAPDSEAFVWGDLHLTYSELDARANQLAHHLADLGVGPEQRVGLLLERGPELIFSILAIVKAGGCYVPLDPSYPAERLDLMLTDSGIRVLVSRSGLTDALTADVRIVHINESADLLASMPVDAVRSGATPQTLAYINYTSGSTGRPKGVMVGHREVVQLVMETDFVQLRPGDRIAQASNPSFDALTFEMWGAWLNGATLVGIPRDVLLASGALRTLLREERITTLYQTTALLNQLTREQPDIFSTLREVLFGGQASDADRIRALIRNGKPRRLLHVYGPTETTAWCTYEDVTCVAPDALTVSVGKPIGNARIYVLDAALQPTPAGVPGEAYVGGGGVVRGYLDRPGLTAQRFVPDPFSAEPGARMYRTGDRMRWVGSAEVDETTPALTHARTHALEFIGRLDGQVKIRGFRIEPGEVESVLSAHEGVAEARVIVREDVPGEKQLVAYVVGEANAPELRAHLRQSLPEYMVPAAVVTIDRLPLTPNGKLDVRALPAPGFAAEAYVEPRTELEAVLAEVWAPVLGMEKVGVTAGFFAMGGHSLLAMQTASRMRDALRMEVPLRLFFEAPTIEGLAERLTAMEPAPGVLERTARLYRRVAAMPDDEVEAMLASTGGGEGELDAARRQALHGRLLRLEGVDAGAADAILPRGDDGPAPLSFAQERLLLIDRMQPGLSVYNVSTGLRIRGALGVDALRRALGEIVRRHEVLRTRLVMVDGAAVQVVSPAEVGIVDVDLSDHDVEAREAELRAYARAQVELPFDLAVDAPIRASLLRLGDEDHALLLVIHHTAIDGWSLSPLYRELDALYTAFAAGEPSPLPDLPIQYADFAAWQRDRLRGAELERQVAWWKQRLAWLPELLEIPADRPRPAVKTYRGAVHRVELPRELADALHALSRREGATLFMTLLAGFQALLHRYTGEADFAVGTPVAGRTRPEVEGLIGLFVNTLVLRADVSGDPDFRALLRRVRETTLGAWAHQDAPFERLVEELQVGRSLGHNPLFQVVFQMQAAGDTRVSLGGLEIEHAGTHDGGAKFDLNWTLVETERGIEGSVEYSTDLFDAATIERMAEHFRALLTAAAADPAAPVSALPMLSADERAALAAWGGAETPCPADSIDRVFADRAAETPDAVALETADEKITYAQLDARANRLARRLRTLGVEHGARVGVMLERSPALVEATLAALRAGAAYLPLDPQLPAERLAHVLADADPAVVVTTSALAERLPAHGGRTLRVDVDADLAAESAQPIESTAGPESVAYVMYTSGSTGTPRGVEVPHRAVVRLVREANFIRIDPTDVFLQLAPTSFDAATLELWGPLLNGARLALYPPEPPTLQGIADAIQRHGVTTLWLTAGLFHVMVDERIDALRPVRQLLAGGDVLSVAHVRRVLAELPGTTLINGYGPTENTTFTACHAIRAEDVEHHHIPIGRPIRGTRIHVLDGRMQPVPSGVAGELCTAGWGLARGYLNAPELTAEKFVTVTIDGREERVYRTGDRVRWTRGGVLEFLGRMDQQVKIRGYRVEPAEIENVLDEHPSVAEAAVVARQDAPGDRRLVAYVVSVDGDTVDAAELRAWLSSRLPAHMVPSAFVAMDALPLTANGKVDRRALPATELVDEVAEFVAPRTALEALLAELWGEVLGLERVGVTEAFWDVGGHSLRGMQIAARLRDALRVEVPLRLFFEAPTIARLAERLNAAETEPGSVERAARLARIAPDGCDAIARRADGGPAPLSFAQERLWVIDQLEPGSAAYTIATGLRLRGALDVAALRRAFTEVERRHEALRTNFVVVDGAPVQVVSPEPRIDIPLIDLSPGDDEALRAYAAEEAGKPFDLSNDALVRVRLVRMAADEHALILLMHHAVADGWSLALLFGELSALYKTYKNEEQSQLPPLPIQYADFAAWQREYLDGPEGARQVEWWRARLAGLPEVLELPADRPRPPVASHGGAMTSTVLPLELADALRDVSRREGTSLFMTLLAGFAALLHRYTGETDIAVGTPIAGRTRPEAEALIGDFVNTLVLRTDVGGAPRFGELLGRVREATLGAYAHQDLPFERLVDELRPERSLSHAPLFHVMFALQNTGELALRLDGIEVQGLPVPHETSRFDLALSLVEVADGIHVSAEYATDLFDRSTVDRMLEHFRALLTAATADADQPIIDLPLLSDAERATVVSAWNATDAPYATGPVHALVSAQAARTPDVLAVTGAGEALTYAELEDRANRLAHHLLRSGVVRGEMVALSMERAPSLLVAMLAVWRAGAAYVPIDPAYPEDRRAYMLADSGASVVLADSASVDGIATDARVVVVDRIDLAAEAASAPPVAVDADDLAYVIYTSGSTGRPKGVMVPHGGVVNFLASMAREPGMAADDVLAAVTSLSFDIAVLELLLPPTVGARVVIATRDEAMDAARLMALLAESGATVMQATPATWRMLVQAGWDGDARLAILSGGEALQPDLARELLPRGRGLWNLYGPTESTIWSAVDRVESAESIFLGHPIANTQLYVLDPALRPCPLGVPGELFIGGDGVVRGYLRRPSLTAERFVPDPFSAEPGARMYRTGDRVRRRADGALEFLGRIDFQVKVRGFRIELGEIEAALADHPSVRHAVAVVREDAPGDARIVAYVVPHGAAPSSDELRQMLAKRLPDYMVPTAFVALDAMPLTPNGKVDRKALPAPEWSAEADYEAPRTATEQTLAALWCELLGVEQAGRTDGFFALGGHSLRAARLASRVRGVFSIEMPLRAVFEHATLA